MIRIEEHVDLEASPDKAFAFLADFRNLPLWDPGIATARLVNGIATDSSARYAIESLFLGRRLPLRYATVRYDADAREAVIEGEGDGVVAVDRIFMTPRPGGASRLRWQADFELQGPARFMEWASKPLFVRLGQKAMDGLRRYASSDPELDHWQT